MFGILRSKEPDAPQWTWSNTSINSLIWDFLTAERSICTNLGNHIIILPLNQYLTITILKNIQSQSYLSKLSPHCIRKTYKIFKKKLTKRLLASILTYSYFSGPQNVQDKMSILIFLNYKKIYERNTFLLICVSQYMVIYSRFCIFNQFQTTEIIQFVVYIFF